MDLRTKITDLNISINLPAHFFILFRTALECRIEGTITKNTMTARIMVCPWFKISRLINSAASSLLNFYAQAKAPIALKSQTLTIIPHLLFRTYYNVVFGRHQYWPCKKLFSTQNLFVQPGRCLLLDVSHPVANCDVVANRHCRINVSLVN